MNENKTKPFEYDLFIRTLLGNYYASSEVFGIKGDESDVRVTFLATRVDSLKGGAHDVPALIFIQCEYIAENKSGAITVRQ